MKSNPPFQPYFFHDLQSYRDHVEKFQAGPFIEEEIRAANPDGKFTVPGYCWFDGAQVDLAVDYLYAPDEPGRHPVWRERMVCPACNLNNRQRATLHLIGELGLPRNANVYITEQLSNLYVALKTLHPKTVASEFLGDDAKPGAIDIRGVRHEDMTRLSFPDESLDAVLTFDVLEHVPGFRRAIAECARVLKPGGALLLSVPFLDLQYPTRIRASFGADGTLIHHEPAQYHGDPVTAQGVLCYQEFGWDLLDMLREAGLEDARAICYRSVEYGYLGGWPLVFEARKPGQRLARSIRQTLSRLLR
jgi:SAM-dependent methyltransferase